jgi:hypothetical protein
MSSNRTFALLPVAGISRSIASIVAGLRSDAPDVLELSVDQVCRRTISMLRSASPFIENSIKICLPFLLLGYGVSRLVSRVFGLGTVGQQIYSSCLSQVTVRGVDPLSKQVCAWIAEHHIGQNSRSLTTSIGLKPITENKTSTLMFLPSLTTTAWFKFEAYGSNLQGATTMTWIQ